MTALLPVTILAWSAKRTTSRGRDTVTSVPVSLCDFCNGILPYWRWDRWLAPMRNLALLGILLTLVTVPQYAILCLAIAVLAGVSQAATNAHRQSRYKALLKSIGQYRTLFEEYPDAVVHAPHRSN